MMGKLQKNNPETDVKEIGHPQDARLNLDKILEEDIGEGRYQVMAIILCGLICFLYGLTANDFIFVAERVKTRCKIHECEDQGLNTFSPPWLAYAVPEFGQTYDSCHRFASSNNSNISTDSCTPALFDRSSIVQCTDHVYQHNNSAVYEFGLACDEWRWLLLCSAPHVGMMVSLPLAGFISDRWGRRFALTITAFNLAWISVCRSWANSYIVYIIIVFLGRLFGGGVSSCVTLVLELVHSRRRMVVGSTLTTCTTLGAVVKGLVAWTQPNWRHLILILNAPMLISITYFWIAPESIRWLLSKNNFEESRTLLIKAAKMNGKALSDETLEKISESTRKTKEKDNVANLSLVFQYKSVLLRCVVISVWSLSSALLTLGLAISSVSLSGNKYVNFCAVCAVAIPGFWTATLIIKKVGRRPLLLCLFWISGFCQLGHIFVPSSSHRISLVLYLFSKFCAAAVHTSLVVYIAELLPTSHRSRLSSFTSIFGRIGALIGLLTPVLADRVWEHSPQVLFSAMAFLSGLLVLLTPETLGNSLPETLEDADQLGNDQWSWVRKLRNLLKMSC